MCLLGFTRARTYARRDLSVVLCVPSMVPRVLTAQASIMSHSSPEDVALGRAPWTPCAQSLQLSSNPAVPLGALGVSLGVPGGALGDPVGVLGGPLGVLGGPLGGPWGALGKRWI